MTNVQTTTDLRNSSQIQSRDVQNYEIRPLRKQDNAEVAKIIRTVMPEFGANGPGFAIHDPEVDDMFSEYTKPGAAYFVICKEGKILGGGGIARLSGGDQNTCELRKMYFLPELRGLGLGTTLLEKCLETAREFGYSCCYLETLKNMARANKLYKKFGFVQLSKPMGTTGHFGCDAWYSRDL